MEKFSQEFNPLTGVLTTDGFEDGKIVIHKQADLEHNLEYATALRNSDEYSAQGIKRGFFHAAHIPEIVQLKLLESGIDIYRASAKEIVAGMRKLGMDNFITTRKQV